MPVGSGGNVPAKFDMTDPSAYMDPPSGMTQAQALEAMADQALAAGMVSQGTWNAPPGSAPPAPNPATTTRASVKMAKPPLQRVFPPGTPGIPKSARFHEPAATPQQEVITAYKRARLAFGQRGIRLTGAVEKEYDFRQEMVATCTKGSAHPPGAPIPAKSCSCGFYAMYDLAAIENGFWQSNCTLEVQMFGRVVRGRTGCRAQKQRIIGVILDPVECSGWLCSTTPMGLGLPGDAAIGQPAVQPFDALCRDHFESYNPLRRASLAQLRNLTGLEFRWAAKQADDDNESEWL